MLKRTEVNTEEDVKKAIEKLNKIEEIVDRWEKDWKYHIEYAFADICEVLKDEED